MTLPIGFSNSLRSGRFIDLAFEPSIGITTKKLLSLDESLKSFRTPLEISVRTVMRPSIATNFKVGGRPEWTALAPSTLARREREGSGTAILSPTKKLDTRRGGRHLRTVAAQQNIWTIGKTTAIIDGMALSARVPYAGIHQAGAGHGMGAKPAKDERGRNIFVASDIIPARPFLMIQPQDAEKIEQIFLEWLELRIEIDWAKL